MGQGCLSALVGPPSPEERQYKIDCEINKLIKQGHRCIICRETYPSSYSYCGEKVCTGKKSYNW